jgi:hypothetical protein
MDTERGAACRLLVETTRRPFLPDMSEQVDHMSREFYPELDLDNKPLLYVTPNFPPVTTAEPHRDLSREGSSRNGAFTVDVKTVSGSKEEFAIKRLPLTTALAEVAMTQYVGTQGLAPFSVQALMITGKPSGSKDRSAWIMTRFDEKAVNFEGLAWREMSSENIKQHLVDALLALSALHKIHIAHKDAFMRNLVRLSGSDGDNSATRYIDFEYARSFRGYVEQVDRGEDIFRAQGYINRSVQGDLRSLLIDAISVLANQLNQSPADRWKLLGKCLDGYQEMASVSGNSTALKEAAGHAIATLRHDYT